MSVLYLLRHGEAEGPSAHDEMRRLTDEGFQQVTRAAGHLPKGQLVLYHSPYVRATESAQAVARIASPKDIHSASWLTPEVPADQVVAQLELLASRDCILVTHNPLVSQLAAMLTGKSVQEVLFPTGALARLEADDWLPGTMTFRWC